MTAKRAQNVYKMGTFSTLFYDVGSGAGAFYGVAIGGRVTMLAVVTVAVLHVGDIPPFQQLRRVVGDRWTGAKKTSNERKHPSISTQSARKQAKTPLFAIYSTAPCDRARVHVTRARARGAGGVFGHFRPHKKTLGTCESGHDTRARPLTAAQRRNVAAT